MNYLTIHKFLFVVSLGMFLNAMFAGGGYAATKGGNLDERHAVAGISCTQCHGNLKKKEAVSMAACLNCHGDTKKLAEKTATVKPVNPHQNRHYGTEADCNRCHHIHVQSENFCLPCHQRFNFVVP